MTIRIASDVLAAIRAEAAASPDREVCGLLLGTRGAVDRALPCANVAAAPAVAFEIDPAALLAAHREARGGGPAVVGHYHSHPSGCAEPSACDAAAATGDGALWLIAGGGALRAWRAVEPGRFVEEAIAPHAA